MKEYKECPKCHATGVYARPSQYGHECFRCEGSGKVEMSPREKSEKIPSVAEVKPKWSFSRVYIIKVEGQHIVSRYSKRQLDAEVVIPF